MTDAIERSHPDVGLSVPAKVDETPVDQRAVQLPNFLLRILPSYGTPQWLQADMWRSFVRNQPLAVICRDTLISNLLALDWKVSARNAEDEGLPRIKNAVDYYTELFTYLEGDFDTYIDLMVQDLLTLPFGGAAEIGRVDDDPDGAVLWAEHIDAATLYPTYDRENPVTQMMREVPARPVVFPAHAIERIYLSPRPELLRRGWGMAPPEKIYLAIEMLFRGDHYYWKLLIDTPEAGILDLGDMSEAAAKTWIESFRELFSGVDGMKVPILHSHTTPASWIPFNRPPIDLLYDKTTLKYAQILAAGYGIRLSDLGMGDLGGGGEGTLAGVIRGERQTRRTGSAVVREKTSNHFNHLLPRELMFGWVEQDIEEVVGRGRALLALSQGLGVSQGSGLISAKEGRAELAASGLLKTEINPEEMPEQETQDAGFAGALQRLLGGGGGDQGQAEADAASGEDEVPVSDGGRGDMPGPVGRAIKRLVSRRKEPGRRAQPTQEQLLRAMRLIVAPGLEAIKAKATDVRLRRLIRAATRYVVPEIAIQFRSLTDEQITENWLPEMHKLTFGEPSIFSGSELIERQDEEARKIVENHLDDEGWWKTASSMEKSAIVDLYVASYERGIALQADRILRALYEEGIGTRPDIVGINFNLRNRKTIAQLRERAAEMVRRVDEGTKTFLQRMIVSGVRQGLSSPDIARAMREGAVAEDILKMDGFTSEVIDTVLRGLTDMSEFRTESITNTEIARAENSGLLGQLEKSGLTQKAWRHFGPEGISPSGNLHPCEICSANEALGFVPLDYMFETVFEPAATPPAHPSVDHCGIVFSEEELFEKVASGEYEPWTGD
jgi:hypothetical protein